MVFMKRKILLVFLSLICVTTCTLGLSACGLFGGKPAEKQKFAVYHLNGGYFGEDDDEDETYTYTLSDDGINSFTPMKAKKQTWVFQNWYFDENLTEEYSLERFKELYATRENVDLYAKWVDEVTVTADNFTEFFKDSSRWNGGGSIGNAGIIYSVTPIVVFDPENSAQSFEVEINPVLTANNEVVWDGGKSTVALTQENDYALSGVKAIDKSAAGVQFDILGRTLIWELKTQSFDMKLLHKVPVNITLELNGGECASDTLTVNGGDELTAEDLPSPRKSGYRFLGWFKDADFQTEYEDWVVTRARTLYAKFQREITVTFHMNGAEEKQPLKFLSTEYVTSGSTPVREGYKFFGYYTTPDFKEESKFSARPAGENDIDLYARWEALHTITFETKGGSAKEPLKVAETEVPKLGDDPTKGLLKFAGWYTDKDYNQKYEPAPVIGDITLYALWVEEHSFSSTPNVEDLREYIDIQLEETRPDGVLTLTLTLTVKEKYRKYGLVFQGEWRVNLTDDNGASCGNGTFGSGRIVLSTLNGKVTATEVYTATKGTLNNEATAFELTVGGGWGYVNIPEGGFPQQIQL